MHPDLNEVCQTMREILKPGLPKTTSGQSNFSGACLHASILLLEAVHIFTSYPAQICGGSGEDEGALDAYGRWQGHYWVEVETTTGPVILDITSDQFGFDPITILTIVPDLQRYRRGDQAVVNLAVHDLCQNIGLLPLDRAGLSGENEFCRSIASPL